MLLFTNNSLKYMTKYISRFSAFVFVIDSADYINKQASLISTANMHNYYPANYLNSYLLFTFDTVTQPSRDNQDT